MFYDMPVKSSVKKEINNIIKEITNYFDNNYIEETEVAIHIKDKSISTIIEIDIFNKYLLLHF